MQSFCIAQFSFSASEMATSNDLPPEVAAIIGNNVAEVFENILKLFLWISRRYYEVMIFQTLQNVCNRLELLSTSGLLALAQPLLNVLRLGSIEICQPEAKFLVRMNTTFLLYLLTSKLVQVWRSFRRRRGLFSSKAKYSPGFVHILFPYVQ